MNNKQDMSHGGQKSDRGNNNTTGKNQYSASGSRSDTKSAGSRNGSSSNGSSSKSRSR